jgi:hypothetical protein
VDEITKLLAAVLGEKHGPLQDSEPILFVAARNLVDAAKLHLGMRRLPKCSLEYFRPKPCIFLFIES